MNTGLRRCVLVMLVMLSAPAVPAQQAQQAPQARQAPGVSGFQAFLFNSNTGTMSPDILGMEGGVGNAPAGVYKSVSTFVVVKVAFGRDVPVPEAARLRLVATEQGAPRGRVLLDRTVKLGPVAADGTTHVGFWLSDTGCRPVLLRATLTGQGGPAKNAILPFACYE